MTRQSFPWEWIAGGEPNLELVWARQDKLHDQMESIANGHRDFRILLQQAKLYEEYAEELAYLETRYGCKVPDPSMVEFWKDMDARRNGRQEETIEASPQVPQLKPVMGGSGESSGNCCPECGVIMIFQEGCLLCQSCGYSKCG